MSRLSQNVTHIHTDKHSANLLSYLTNKLGCFYRTGKKVRGPSDFLSENQLMGPQEWIDVKKILQDPWHHPSTWG